VLTLGQIQRVANFGKFQGLFIFSVIYALAITAIVVGRLQTFKSITAQQWSIAALFLLMPHIYAFGTNGNYWEAGSSAALFWLLSGLTLLGPMIRNRGTWILALPVAFATQAITATLLQTGLEQPYRQPQPLRLNSSVLEIGPHKSPLILSQKYAEYISIAVSSAHAAGFVPNTPMIDLTGQSPGILYAIGAKSIGQAWMIGGYPGSLRRSQISYLRLRCEDIISSWVLLEPNGPRSIPVEFMDSLGLRFPDGYERVASWRTAEGAGGYPDRRNQELYRPVLQNKSQQTCQQQRLQ
jgi:hypothetical protein